MSIEELQTMELYVYRSYIGLEDCTALAYDLAIMDSMHLATPAK